MTDPPATYRIRPRAGRPSPPAGRTCLLVLGLLLAVVPAAEAQQRRASPDLLRVGVHGAYAGEVLGGTPGVGARASIGLERLVPGLRLLGSVETFFPGCGDVDCEYREANLNLILGGPAGREGGPWLGAGINHQALEDPGDPTGPLDDTFLGGNLVLGFALERRGPVHPFAEARWEILSDGVQQLVLSVGLLY